MASRHGSGAIVLHWLLVAVVLIAGVLGLLHDSWPKHSRAFWINLHALAGILVWAVLMVRLWLLLRQRRLAAARGARVVHFLLYSLLLLTPAVGLMAFIWHGRVLNLAAWQIDFGINEDRSIFEPAEDIHGYMAYAIFALLGVHIAAVLWLHYVGRDDVLRNMWWKN
jgi:cytochrome b561